MASKYRLDTKQPHLVSLLVLSAFASMGAVLMAPALPNIATYFHITQGHAQLTVTLFLLGYSLGQLIYGPLANRYGRKPAFYVGICIATVGSLFSILSSPLNSYSLLLMGRLLEALGSSAGLVISFTIVADFYYPDQMRRIISYIMLAFAIVPAIAVFLGGLIVQYLNWQSCFYFLLAYGLLLIIPAYLLPETLIRKDFEAIQVRRIHRGYMQVFTNLPVLQYSILAGLTSTLIYIFAAEGPFIGIHFLGLSASHYGSLATLPSIGMLVGSVLAVYFSQRVSANKLIMLGILSDFIAAISMLILFLTHHVSMISLLVPMSFILLGHALISSNSSSSAIFFAVDKANGSAVLNFICIALCVIGTFVLSIFHTNDAYVMPLIFLVCIVLLSILLSIVKKYKQ